MKPRHIVILGYDQIMGLDLVGPMEAFGSAHMNSPKAGRETCYRVTIAALEAKKFRSEFEEHLKLGYCPYEKKAVAVA